MEVTCGVVTTGKVWQFLCLHGPTVTLHRERQYIIAVGAILAVLRSILASGKAGETGVSR